MADLSLENLFGEILKAEKRLRPYIVETPVITNDEADAITGRELFFKCENLQRTGAFKARGALNAVLAYLEENPKLAGVVGFSGGNHGLALAWAAKKFGLPCTIVVPGGTVPFRIQLIEKQGAQCVISGSTHAEALALCEHIASSEGKKIISPYDDIFVIAGQGTIGLELLRQVPNLDSVLVAVSGGGLIAGISIAIARLQPNIQVYSVEPEGKDLQPSLEKSAKVWPIRGQFLPTVASVLKVQEVGDVPFPIICRYASKAVLTVSDQEMIDAMKWTWENLKVIVEVSSAATVAAALSSAFRAFPGKRIGVILCGGNCPVDSLLW